MKMFLLLLTFVASTSQAAVVCKNGPVNLSAKAICVDAVNAYGKIKQISEGYGRIGFNQFTSFCMAMTDGQVCSCEYSFFGSPATGPHVSCSQPNWPNEFKGCTSRLREQCRM